MTELPLQPVARVLLDRTTSVELLGRLFSINSTCGGRLPALYCYLTVCLQSYLINQWQEFGKTELSVVLYLKGFVAFKFTRGRGSPTLYCYLTVCLHSSSNYLVNQLQEFGKTELWCCIVFKFTCGGDSPTLCCYLTILCTHFSQNYLINQWQEFGKTDLSVVLYLEGCVAFKFTCGRGSPTMYCYLTICLQNYLINQWLEFGKTELSLMLYWKGCVGSSTVYCYLTVCLHSSLNYLINQWQELGKTELPGEEVLVLAWLHSGIQVWDGGCAR